MSYIYNRVLIILGIRNFHQWNTKYNPDLDNIENNTIIDTTSNKTIITQIDKIIENNDTITKVNNTTDIDYMVGENDINNNINYNINDSNLTIDMKYNTINDTDNDINDINHMKIEMSKMDNQIDKDLNKIGLLLVETTSNVKNDTITKYNIYQFFYHLIIFGIILFDTISIVILLINNKFNYFPPSIFFSLLIPIEYILAILYFNNSHFDIFYLNDRNTELLNCIPKILYIIMAVLITSIISIILSISFKVVDISGYNKDFDIFHYNEQPVYIKIIIILFDSIKLFFGRTVLLINMTSFTIVFCKHIKIIEYISNLLVNDIYHSYDIKQLSNICKYISRIRHELHISIKLLEQIFSMSTIFGAVAIGYIVNTLGKFNLRELDIFSIVLFGLIQSIFFYIVYKVTNLKEDLHKLINSPKISQKFLSRLNNNCIHYNCHNENDIYIDKIDKMMRIQHDNATSIDWLILNNILNQKWTEFSVFGMTLEDGAILKKFIVLGTIFILVLQYIK